MIALRRAGGFVRITLHPGADEDADDRIVLEQRQIHGERRNFAAGEADRKQPAVPAHKPRQGREQRAADIVDADVEAFAPCKGLHTFTHVLARMVDDLGGAMRADHGRLRSTAHDGNDPRADQMRDLDTGEANAAGGPRHQHRLAGLQPRPLNQCIPGREIGVQHRRPHGEINVGRQHGDAALLGDHALRKCTEPVAATDPVAGPEARDPVAAGQHDAGGIRSRHIGKRRPHLIAAAAHQVVHVADGRGMDVDENLVCCRARFGRPR